MSKWTEGIADKAAINDILAKVSEIGWSCMLPNSIRNCTNLALDLQIKERKGVIAEINQRLNEAKESVRATFNKFLINDFVFTRYSHTDSNDLHYSNSIEVCPNGYVSFALKKEILDEHSWNEIYDLVVASTNAVKGFVYFGRANKDGMPADNGKQIHVSCYIEGPLVNPSQAA